MRTLISLLFVFTFIAVSSSCKKDPETITETITVTDTLVIRDTLVINDTIAIHDTLENFIPMDSGTV
ncbi:MAG: hypothetical protein IH946_10465, partial [Bacteroidetes bacterium]|nr:hypothetical protein [Bacteroidota bacterium]